MVVKILSFLLGLGAISIYYANVWCYAKLKVKLEKYKVKYGKKSNRYGKLRRRISVKFCSLPFRITLFVALTVLTFLLLGRSMLLPFTLGVFVGNLMLFSLMFKSR